MDCIVNNDELTMNYDAGAPAPVPAQDQIDSPQTPGKENIHEGDLGLGGYELQLEYTPGQSQLTSLA